MMSKHLQLYHAACADHPMITPQKFREHGVIIGHLLVLFSATISGTSIIRAQQIQLFQVDTDIFKIFRPIPIIDILPTV